MQQKIIPNLWLDTQAEEAASFYTSVFKASRIVNVTHYTEAGNGGPDFTFHEAVSFQITCEDQDEIDPYWERLSEGGEEGPCGWLKDRYGLSWQVVPGGMDELFADPDRGAGPARNAGDARGAQRSTSPRCAAPPTACRRADGRATRAPRGRRAQSSLTSSPVRMVPVASATA